MPLYEYECENCHRRTEKIENVNGPHLKKCPDCGGKVERLVSSSAIQFKGSGWYVTDYAGKKSAPSEGVAAGKPDSQDSSSGEDSASKDSNKDSSSKPSSTKASPKGSSSSSDSKDKKSAKKKD